MKKKEKEELSQILETSIPDRNKIITYYNIFYILKNILLPIDTIIYDKFIDSKTKKLEKKYVKVKSIECTNQLSSIKMLAGSNINVYFKIKFEDIPTKSILRFNLHIKDENYIQEKINEKLNSSDFKDYGSKLFISNLNSQDNILFY